MPRPKKCRRICKEPDFNMFGSLESKSTDIVMLNIDEYEVIRLIDYEKNTHIECAKQMGIARTTVTEIYEQARFKVADCIINGKQLHITGGNYIICDGKNFNGCRKKCHHRCRQIERESGNKMKIAVPVDENKKDVCPSFGRTPYFMIYDMESEKVEIVSNSAAEAQGGAGGKAAQLLLDLEVGILITPRAGENAAEVLKEAEIEIYKTISNDAMANIKEYKEGKLEILTKFHAGFHGKV